MVSTAVDGFPGRDGGPRQHRREQARLIAQQEQEHLGAEARTQNYITKNAAKAVNLKLAKLF